jgi:hypothetical protein
MPLFMVLAANLRTPAPRKVDDSNILKWGGLTWDALGVRVRLANSGIHKYYSN